MWWEQTISQGQKHPASSLQPKGTAQHMPSESTFIIEALFPLAKLWSAEQHHQNRANTAGSYYKGKPGPEDQAPSASSNGESLQCPLQQVTWRYAQVAWTREKRRKPTRFMPLHFHSQVYSKGNLILMVTNRWVTETEHFHDTPPSPQTKQRWHIIPLLVWHTGTKYPRALARHRIRTEQRRQWLVFRTSVV